MGPGRARGSPVCLRGRSALRGGARAGGCWAGGGVLSPPSCRAEQRHAASWGRARNPPHRLSAPRATGSSPGRRRPPWPGLFRGGSCFLEEKLLSFASAALIPPRPQLCWRSAPTPLYFLQSLCSRRRWGGGCWSRGWGCGRCPGGPRAAAEPARASQARESKAWGWRWRLRVLPGAARRPRGGRRVVRFLP